MKITGNELSLNLHTLVLSIIINFALFDDK